MPTKKSTTKKPADKTVIPGKKHRSTKGKVIRPMTDEDIKQAVAETARKEKKPVREMTPDDLHDCNCDMHPKSETPPPAKQYRGFARLSAERVREIAAMGGKASHANGAGHEWTKEAAREAGRKGGLASHGGRGKTTKPAE